MLNRLRRPIPFSSFFLAILMLWLTSCAQTAEPGITVTVSLPGALATTTSTHVPTETAAPTFTPSPSRTPLPPTSTLQPTSTPTVPTATPRPTDRHALGDTLTRPADGMLMLYVPSGEFLMGSADTDPVAQPQERPQHTVYLDPFWIDRTEVTVAQFRLFVQATGYRTTAEEQGGAYAYVESAGEWQEVDGADWQHPFGPQSNAVDNHPVTQVTWSDAVAYCTWTGGSLPTEAQWEKAARGSDGRLYPWGDAFDGALLNYCDASCGGDATFDDDYPFTAPVGSYPAGASPYGALDMAGNVWEWTADRYNSSYYAHSPSENPTGPTSGASRVLRGGSWNHDRTGMRVAYRLDAPRSTIVDNFGFRCVWPVGN